MMIINKEAADSIDGFIVDNSITKAVAISETEYILAESADLAIEVRRRGFEILGVRNLTEEEENYRNGVD